MNERKTYGECLSDILGTINLKSSKLAREINIDSSLVYKWLRNERVPSYESPYIDLILNCILKRFANLSQKEALIEMLKRYDIELKDTDDETVLNQLRQILQKAQGYSIRLRNEIKSRHKLLSSKNLKINSLIQKQIAFQDGTPRSRFGTTEASDSIDSNPNEYLLGSPDYVQIINNNHPEIIFSTVQLLKQALDMPASQDDTILLTLNGDLKLLFVEKDINRLFVQALSDLLQKGWHVICKIKIDSNISRTIKIIKSLQCLLSAGNLTIYYDENPPDLTNDTELCIIPKVGALYSFPTQIRDQVDNAFLFQSNKIIEMLTSRFFYNLNAAKLLLKSYPAQNSTEFQREFTESEETPGNRFVIKGGLSTITIPLALYEQYLKKGMRSDQEISYRMLLHKKRLDAFKTHVKHYRFKDMLL